MENGAKPKNMKQKKATLRAELIKKRLEIPPEIAREAALALANKFLDIPQDKIVAGYVAMRGEIDVMPLLKKLGTRGNQICLPVIMSLCHCEEALADAAIQKHKDWIASASPRNDESERKSIVEHEKILKFLSWSPDEELCAGKFGALCPLPHLPELVPDIIIVPLVGFDENLHRLGYGGGYYDATIRNFREKNPSIRVIGAAYNIQKVENLPSEAHDEKLDSVVIEDINITVTHKPA